MDKRGVEMLNRFLVLLVLFINGMGFTYQLPQNVMVGYWENWGSLSLTEIPKDYNVVQLAFGTTPSGSDHKIVFNVPNFYTDQEFKDDLKTLNSEGRSVILSIGGASDPIIISDSTEARGFVHSVDSILKWSEYEIHGIDLDFESTSLDFGPWTMTELAEGQKLIIWATKEIAKLFKEATGEKMILTMAPETVYLLGGLSDWQVNNVNGGAWLPILVGLLDDLDLIMPQYYNAGGAEGGTFGVDGKIYYDTGDPEYLTAITEGLIIGYTLKGSKGEYSGIPANKIAIGLPSNSCGAAGTGYVEPSKALEALDYLRGSIAKPETYVYTLQSSYSDIRGFMTWSINQDYNSCEGEWHFIENIMAGNFAVPLEKLKITPIFKTNHSYNIMGQKLNSLTTKLKSGNSILLKDSKGIQPVYHK